MNMPVDIATRIEPYLEQGLELWLEAGSLRFKAPKTLVSNDLIAFLKKDKQRLIEWLNGQDLHRQIADLPVEKPEIGSLSSTQSAIWMLYKFSPNNAAYNTAFVCQLKSGVNIDALEKALRGVVIRHPMLKTTFKDTDEGPKQFVWPSIDLPFTVHDASKWEEADLNQKIETACDETFDLKSDPILRVHLFENSIKGDLLVATIHHIGTDLWSLTIIAEELIANYEKAVLGEPLALTKQNSTYLDHVAWQSNYLKGAKGKQAKLYWQQQLEGAPIEVTLPIDGKRSLLLTMESDFYVKALQADITAKIRAYCKSIAITPFIFMQGIFQLLVARESGKEDFLIGTPTLGRTALGTDKIVGDFANPVVLRSNIDHELSFKDFFHNIKQRLNAALEYQDYPFPNVVQDCNPPRDASRTPLFQLMFIWHQANTDLLTKNQLVEKVLDESGPRGTPYDVMLSISDLGIQLELNWTYQKDLYSKERICRYSHYYVKLLNWILEQDINANIGGTSTSFEYLADQNKYDKHCSLFLLNELDKQLPQRTAYYRCVFSENIADVTKQLFVEGSPFSSPILEKAYHRVVFINRLPYDVNGNVDDAALDSIVTADAEKLSMDTCILYKQVLKNETDLPPLVSEKTQVKTGDLESRPLAYAKGKALNPKSLVTTAPNLAVALRQTAYQSSKKGFLFVDSDGSEAFYSYSDLYLDAKKVAGNIKHSEQSIQDIALIQMEVNQSFFALWWGLILAGIKPLVIAKPAVLDRNNGLANKLLNVACSLESIAVFADSNVVNKTSEFLGDSIPVVDVGAFLNFDACDSCLEDADISNYQYGPVAFLQLTSGSTGVPKAIQITHSGVLHHINAVAEHNHYTDQDRTLNWLPFDHVVPLLTTHVKDVVMGIDQVQLQTNEVLNDAWYWVEAMSRYQITHSWCPNFGFQRVADQLALDNDRLEKLNLSSVKFLMNAGEQVLPSTVNEFLAVLKPFGLKDDVLQPAFGMAESCTCITYQNKSEYSKYVFESSEPGVLVTDSSSNTPQYFANLGSVVPGVEIRIADKDQMILKEGVVGRLQIKGPVVTPGYLNNEEANKESFVGEGWFNSGDLGFIWNGDLFLTGREKEMIVVNGANLYCYDIEQAVSNIPGIEQGFVAATGVSTQSEGNDDELAIFYVTKNGETNTKLESEIVSMVAEQCSVNPEFLIAVAKDEFHKTTSGKIQRSQFKKLFNSGEYADRCHCPNSRTHQDTRHVFSTEWKALPFCLKLNRWESTGVSDLIVDMGRIPATPDDSSWLELINRLADCKARLKRGDIAPKLTLFFRSRRKSDLFLVRPMVETLRQESGCMDISAVIADVSDETTLGFSLQEPKIAWLDRDGALSEPVFTNQIGNPETLQSRSSAVLNRGTYVVSGGLGGVGLVLCHHLIKKYKANLILLGQSSLQDHFEKRLAFEKLAALDSSANVTYLSLAEHRSSLSDAIGEHRKEHGFREINGVFHLAGTYLESEIEGFDSEHWQAAMDAKINLANELLAMLNSQNDAGIFVQFSSINSYWGGSNALTYSLANAYQTLLQKRIAQDHPNLKAWCVHCGLWQRTGMSKNFGQEAIAMSANKGFLALDPTTDIKLIDRVLSLNPDDYYIGMDADNENICQQVNWYKNAHTVSHIYVDCANKTSDKNHIKQSILPTLDNYLPRAYFDSVVVHPLENGLPRTEKGDIDFHALLDSKDSQLVSGSPPSTPRECEIAAVWSDVLNTNIDNVEKSFFEYGGHSINATQIVARLNKKYECQLSVADLFQQGTIRNLANLNQNTASKIHGLSLSEYLNKDSPGIRISKIKEKVAESATTVTLLLMPTACGMLNAYLELVARLDVDVDIFGITLPKVQDPSVTLSITATAKQIARELVADNLDLKKLVVLGWSYGGVLGYEVVEALRELNVEESRLLMLDSGFSDGLNAITFDEGFQQLMYASELGINQADMADYLANEELQQRIDWLSRYLEKDDVHLSSVDLLSWWGIYQARLSHLLRHQKTSCPTLSKATLLKASAHTHGNKQLGWGSHYQSLDVHAINADHLGIIRHKDSIRFIKEVLKKGNGNG